VAKENRSGRVLRIKSEIHLLLVVDEFDVQIVLDLVIGPVDTRCTIFIDREFKGSVYHIRIVDIGLVPVFHFVEEYPGIVVVRIDRTFDGVLGPKGLTREQEQ